MNAVDYVRKVLGQHELGYRHIYEDRGAVHVVFNQPFDVIEKALSDLSFAFTTELTHTGETLAIIQLNPAVLEPTLASAVETVSVSTAAFHKRFETASWCNLYQAWSVMKEEVNEVDREIIYLNAGQDRKAELVEEMADTFVTMLGVLYFANISEAEFAAALVRVAAKNDAKTHETHVIYQGKVTRRSQVKGAE